MEHFYSLFRNNLSISYTWSLPVGQQAALAEQQAAALAHPPLQIAFCKK
jgi:hypothetical protein